MGMRARDVMESPVLTVSADTDALSCARTMVERRKGYAVILDAGGHVAGIVTEWDFLEKVLAAAVDPARVAVGSIGSAKVQSCAPDAPVDEVVGTMAREGIRRMIVRTGDEVLGIITARTVLANFRQYVDRLSSDIAAYHSDPPVLG
jgi:CBS domain-containing protein